MPAISTTDLNVIVMVIMFIVDLKRRHYIVKLNIGKPNLLVGSFQIDLFAEGELVNHLVVKVLMVKLQAGNVQWLLLVRR
jgi:hypothetical protein